MKTKLNKIAVVGFSALLPLLLTGCGSTSGGTTLSNSAALAPVNIEKANTPPLPNEAAPAAKTSVAAKTLAAKKAPIDQEIIAAVKGVSASKSAPVVMAKVKNPPAPVRKPYMKTRSAKALSKAMEKKVTPAKQIAKVAPAKTEVPKGTDLKERPVAVASVKKTVAKQPPVSVAAAKPAKVEMVPSQVIPVQIMGAEVPQDIADAFNEAPSEPEPVEEKVAEAEAAPAATSFGQANHSFSGQ